MLKMANKQLLMLKIFNKTNAYIKKDGPLASNDTKYGLQPVIDT